MSEKLLPCPFCGGEASVHRCEHAFYDAKIRCAGCQAEGPIFDVDDGEANEAGRNEAEAIAAWNRRTPAPEGEAVVCSGCEGHPVFPNVPCAVCGASPVVPVGREESERKLVGQDYINAIKAHRIEHDSSLAVARNAVDCGWRPPAPVVPVGVRERVLDELDKAWLHGQRRTSWRRDESADAILAALGTKPTDTGREG